MRTAILVVACGLAGGVGGGRRPKPGDKKDGPVRELELKEAEFGRVDGKFIKPKKIASAKELADAVPHKATADRIARQVDFDKEYVVLFAWQGSGQDKLTAEVLTGDKGKTAAFAVTPGKTRDLRQHRAAYAVGKDLGFSSPFDDK